MGLLDGLAGQVLGSLAGGDAGSGDAQQGGLLALVGKLIAQHPGGLPGLIGAFESNGLGALAASWVGTGANLPISAEQLQSVLGNQQIGSLAASLGFSPQDAPAKLASMLPQVVDQLTPAGAMPDQASLADLLASLGKL
jgi:uncharacterized protein YidB (DUF937 family)